MEKQYNIPGMNDANSPRTKGLNKLREAVSICNKCGHCCPR
jgi:uncharacterized cysteine cluster protein YcgN (CxxCxxCC family)